jgi:N-acyl-D-aspartate/D-glutamate deacylase
VFDLIIRNGRIVAGTITRRDDQDTGERPGRLLRGKP